MRFEREEQFKDEFGPEDLIRLGNRRLADQLKAYISSRKRKPLARIKAMDIAEACHLHDLESNLIKVVYDKTETISIRAHALFLLGRFGTQMSRQQLHKLINPKEEDPDREILGWTLAAVWPDHISVKELFSVLVDPGDRSFYGGYTSFLHQLPDSLPRCLSGEDLLMGLQWVEGLTHGSDRRDRLQPIGDCILIRAWQELISLGFCSLLLASP